MAAKNKNYIRDGSPALQAIKIFCVTAVVLVAVCFGLWLTISATYENIRLSRQTEQVLGVLAAGRQVVQENKATPTKAESDLKARLLPPLKSGRSVSDEPGIALVNIWGSSFNISLPVTADAMRMELGLPVAVCRRLINFMIFDVQDIGLQRVEVRDMSSKNWRLLIDAPLGNISEKTPSSAAIVAACGQGPNAVLALGFRMK